MALNVLYFTSLFPSASRPTFAPFVKERIERAVATGEVRARVVVPYTWLKSMGHAGATDSMIEENRQVQALSDQDVCYQPYLGIPLLSRYMSSFSMALCTRNTLNRLIEGGFRLDLISAQYFYPDGVAALLLARHFGVPCLITARGSDINYFPRYALAKKQISWAARSADQIVTVSRELSEKVVHLGARSDRVHVISNGVDEKVFAPANKQILKARYGISGSQIALCVGNLVPEKGQQKVVQALPDSPGTHLLLVGGGPMEIPLRELALKLGVSSRVSFLGACPREIVRDMYALSDCLVMASEREGLPNVLLEALASGLPVVAHSVGGIPEVLDSESLGILLKNSEPASIARALRTVPDISWCADRIRRHALKYSWSKTVERDIDIMRSMV